MQGSVLHPWEGAELHGQQLVRVWGHEGPIELVAFVPEHQWPWWWPLRGWGDVTPGAAGEDRALGTKRGAEKWMLCFPSECTRFSLPVLC